MLYQKGFDKIKSKMTKFGDDDFHGDIETSDLGG
jgi:hypothetical protein